MTSNRRSGGHVAEALASLRRRSGYGSGSEDEARVIMGHLGGGRLGSPNLLI